MTRVGRQNGRPPDLMLRAYVAYHRGKGRTLQWIADTLDRRVSGIGRIVNDMEIKGDMPYASHNTPNGNRSKRCRYCGNRYTRCNFMIRRGNEVGPDGLRLDDTHLLKCARGREKKEPARGR